MFNLPPPRHISTLPVSGGKADIAGLPVGAHKRTCWFTELFGNEEIRY